MEEEAIMTDQVAAVVDMEGEEIVTRVEDTKLYYMVSWSEILFCFEVCSYRCVRRRRGVVPPTERRFPKT